MKTSLKAKGPVLPGIRKNKPRKKATNRRAQAAAVGPDPVDGQLNSPERTPCTPGELTAADTQLSGVTATAVASVTPNGGGSATATVGHQAGSAAGGPRMNGPGASAGPAAPTDDSSAGTGDHQLRSQTVPAAPPRSRSNDSNHRRAASLGAHAHGELSRGSATAGPGCGPRGGDRDWPPLPPRNLGVLRPERQGLILLSLFDGLGIATLAVAEVLNAMSAGGALIGTAYVESDADLAAASTLALERVLARKVPRQYLSRNAWDLLRHNLDPLFRFAERLPVGAFLLTLAGTCPFSPLGPRSCREDLGLHGNDPSEFYLDGRGGC